MSEYTQEDLNKFRRLVEMVESINQIERINGRLEMPEFIEKHGRAKCDAMFEALKAEIS